MEPSEAARFEVRDGLPVLTLAVDVPVELVGGPWGLMNRLTLVVVDGPGDAGFLLPRLTPSGDVAPPGWDEAVDKAGGSHVPFASGTVFARTVD